MNLLGVDTTTKKASVSLLYRNKIVTKWEDNEITHSEKLLPLIDEILTENHLTLSDIDQYACINGPGSFTGIRIGLSTLKSFSFVDRKKIFSLSSTDLIALSAYEKSEYGEKQLPATVISLIDARNHRVYHSVTEISYKNGKLTIFPKTITSNDTIEQVLQQDFTKFEHRIFAGNAILLHKNAIQEKFRKDLLLDFYPTTEDLLSFYTKLASPQDYLYDTYTLDANYVRASQAERLQKNES